ncbi:hypothetical protein ACFU8W_30095 [Streptomyces sp. NPDC057565]|uniref:hypothetical protein n=1 Tax=Streptomyces sp. NPDC057565 TaxID=3346169 RepID=UPI003693C12F
MPTPEREAQPQPPVTSAVSMKDLLAACAAANAVSTPPSEEQQERHEPQEQQGPQGCDGERDAA